MLSSIEIAPAFYIENSPPIGITGNLAINDLDNTQIHSATINIISGFASSEDLLSFNSQFGINGSFNSVTGELNLNGQALLSEYETVLRSVTYQNISNNPSDASRTIEFIVNDGENNSNPLSREIEIIEVNDAPVLSTIEPASTSYTENSTPINVSSSLMISDVDDIEIDFAVVSINNNFVSGEDVLSFSPQFGINGSFVSVTGGLTLSGQAFLSEYETVLRSVTYQNISDDPSGLARTCLLYTSDAADE